jgi:chaperonin GroES
LILSLRQVEQDVETVIHVLQPGPVGIVEHKFTDAEILEARAILKKAVDNWRTNSTLERNHGSTSFDKWK